MAQKRTSMCKIREILRLKYELGLSNRPVAKSCGVGRRAVSEYWKLAQESGLDWAEAQRLSDTELEERLFRQGRTTGEKTQPDWNYIYQEMKRPHVTLQLLWQEYREENMEGYQYSWFNELYNQWRKKLNICMRQEHRAGEKLFIDYCDGMPIINRETAEKIATQLFVGVWGASNYTYAEASFTQEKQEWIMAHVRAFEYYGCVPYILVPDNLKSGVVKACRYEPDINRTYLELARHYHTTVIPARPYRAKDKAKVEAGVLMAQRWILACLRNRKFYSLAELNQAIRELLERLNNRQMRKLHRSRKEMFETLDKIAALPLPERRYEYADWKKPRVNIDYHIEVESHYYSVPYQLAHQQVDVRITAKTIEVFFKCQRQASHPRSYVKYGYTTLVEHMPESHRKYLEWTPTRILGWAEKTGPCTKELVKTIIESKQHPEQAYRSCLGIFRLEKYYPKERIENASKRALKYRICSYQSMKSILATGLDKQADLFYGSGNLISPEHQNIRGESYYRNTETN
ncbi:MAG: IS21 family transposase [Deltaproteobacteria bacterium CG03_land_8_20_14_0_80_45_14]|nr:MAG: IS21 family transposase [Deltaproteobacteria bacterium CG03_land_8_20_14_0_80_45_14]